MTNTSIIWIFLHSFAAHIKDAVFLENKDDVMTFIKDLYSTLKCKICKNHSFYYLSNYKDDIETKEDLIMYFYKFHESVNKKIYNPRFDIDNLENYKKTNFNKIINLFLKENKDEKIITFLKSNRNWFN
tara:strand:+ start:788 stop:1174 length:387 start_codon:yes stop_codon:yes gene_type:complete